MSQASLSSGATVSVAAPGSEGAGAIQIHALSLGSGAKLDLSDNTLTISDDQPATVASIRSLLASGFNAGSWDGNGIDSSAAHNDTSFKTALGYKDTGSSIVIAYTYYGDSNLDAVVNAADFQMLLDGLVVTNAGSWAQGITPSMEKSTSATTSRSSWEIISPKGRIARPRSHRRLRRTAIDLSKSAAPFPRTRTWRARLVCEWRSLYDSATLCPYPPIRTGTSSG